MTDKPISRTDTAESVQLLPCPFCGNEFTQVRYIGWKSPSAFDSGYRGECCDCGAITAAYPTEAEAVAAWNTRVDYHGYEQAAIEAWGSIKTWNARAERTCRMETAEGCQNWHSCSVCDADYYTDQPINYCPNCGAKVVD